jgi:hypothetical protein
MHEHPTPLISQIFFILGLAPTKFKAAVILGGRILIDVTLPAEPNHQQKDPPPMIARPIAYAPAFTPLCVHSFNRQRPAAVVLRPVVPIAPWGR